VHARLKRSGAKWAIDDAGSTNGSYVNGSRVQNALLEAGDFLEVGRAFLMLRSTRARLHAPLPDIDCVELLQAPLGFATLLPHVRASSMQLERVASSGITLLIYGETGTGKEVLARSVHELSGRQGPFVAVNCGALPNTLVEALLFGHVRGAFSGAHADTAGFVRAAQGGTLLLDEVQDLSSLAQAALLRVLQEREVVPVGASRPIPVDVRFIATAPEPFASGARAASIRADLLARLNGLSHCILPLRERREDLGLLIAALLRKAGLSESTTPAPSLSLEFSVRLLRHDWPLNVRELEQLLARGWALATGGIIDAEPSVLELPNDSPAQVESRAVQLSPEDRALRERLIQELTRAKGNVAEAARALGKAPMQVRRWMQRLQVDPASFRG
jgi:transcriptional regulator with PAS, ATPase and Fis domain